MGLTLMSGTYFIWNYNADVVMDLKGGNSTPGTPVIAWKQKPNEQASNQLWHVQEVATGTENTYAIMNDQTKTYLEISGGRDGNSIVCNTKTGSEYQTWVIKKENNGEWKIQNLGYKSLFKIHMASPPIY
ncbi:hypothetical protein L218DRAFT_950552 [Marasmius fiardii PR-910]|nr:hypothetical protein L218DRAFT_950552 [Marasmius fiardii PR-910]